MENSFYRELESIQADDKFDLQRCIEHLSFDPQGLIPVITQCYQSGLILMQAWMNKASIEKTINSGRMVYWSRSRNAFWVKGETSGHVQHLKSMHFDCDGDSILCLVEQEGVACHTGRISCFYLQVDIKNQQLQQGFPSNLQITSASQEI